MPFWGSAKLRTKQSELVTQRWAIPDMSNSLSRRHTVAFLIAQ